MRDDGTLITIVGGYGDAFLPFRVFGKLQDVAAASRYIFSAPRPTSLPSSLIWISTICRSLPTWRL